RQRGGPDRPSRPTVHPCWDSAPVMPSSLDTPRQLGLHRRSKSSARPGELSAAEPDSGPSEVCRSVRRGPYRGLERCEESLAWTVLSGAEQRQPRRYVESSFRRYLSPQSTSGAKTYNVPVLGFNDSRPDSGATLRLTAWVWRGRDYC